LRMYADRKGWPLERIESTVTVDRDSALLSTNITENILLHGNLDTAQKDRLMAIARKCPVYQILTQPIHVVKQLADSL